MRGNQKGEHGAWCRARSTLFSLFNAAKCKFIWRESQSAYIHLYLRWLIRSGPCQEINTKPVGGINTHDPGHHVLGRIINCPTSASGEVRRFQQIIEEVNNPPNHILDKRCRNAKKNATKTNFNTFRKKCNASVGGGIFRYNQTGNETPWWIRATWYLEVDHGTVTQSLTIKAWMTTLWRSARGRRSSEAPPPAPLALCDASSLEERRVNNPRVISTLFCLRSASSVGSFITPLVFNSPEWVFFSFFFCSFLLASK